MSMPHWFRTHLPHRRPLGLMLVGFLVLSGATLQSVALADTGDTGDSGETEDTDTEDSDDGDDGTTEEETETETETEDLEDSGWADDGYQGMGPAELAGEKGGCAFVSQSSAYFALLMWVGFYKRRREPSAG